ncbi:MAG TPA: DUF349 domain-containing protein [Dermatophilaceae bacterium]|nr:DUF349 domain-containing protein [Dermatophilaceae bacterium]
MSEEFPTPAASEELTAQRSAGADSAGQDETALALTRSAPTLDHESGPATEPEPQPAIEPETGPAVAAATEPEPEPKTGPAVAAATEPEPEPEAGPAVAEAAEPEPETGPAVAAATELELESEPQPAPEPETATDTEPVVAPAVPSPAALAARLHAAAGSRNTAYGRVGEDGTVYVRTADGEREVGSYPGASPGEALQYFARKFDEVSAAADLLLQRVQHTDLSSREGSEGLAKLREQTTDVKAVGDLAALEAKVAEIAAAVEAKRAVEGAARAAAREAGRAEREKVVAEAEAIAAQPVEKVQWKSSGNRMRELLEEWKRMQRSGPKLDRESEGALWQRFSAARNGFDKARRVHFAQLDSVQGQAKSVKEELVKQAEQLATSRDWAPTASAFKRLMERWREAGRASRADDDALWTRFKAAQDSFFAAKDKVVATENEHFQANLATKEGLLREAEALLPITDLEAAKASLRGIQDRWDRAGKVPRADMERIDKAMRRVEQTVRDADEQRWKRSNPEAAARARSLVDQLDAAVAGLRRELAKATESGNAQKIADARAALSAREQWLEQARSGLAEFTR